MLTHVVIGCGKGKRKTPVANCYHDVYPYYGPAPHECFYKKGEGYTIGQSTLLPKEQWPDNFALEVPVGSKPEDIEYPAALGVYYCPGCKAGMPKDRILWDRG